MRSLGRPGNGDDNEAGRDLIIWGWIQTQQPSPNWTIDSLSFANRDVPGTKCSASPVADAEAMQDQRRQRRSLRLHAARSPPGGCHVMPLYGTASLKLGGKLVSKQHGCDGEKQG